jgi:hypothetical protein
MSDHPTVKHATAALRSVKAHELSQAMNRLTCGVNWTGSLKSSMIHALCDGHMATRIAEGYGTFDNWVGHILHEISASRMASQERKLRKEEKISRWRRDRDRALELLDRLKSGDTMSAEDRLWVCDLARHALHHYYLRLIP